LADRTVSATIEEEFLYEEELQRGMTTLTFRDWSRKRLPETPAFLSHPSRESADLDVALLPALDEVTQGDTLKKAFE